MDEPALLTAYKAFALAYRHDRQEMERLFELAKSSPNERGFVTAFREEVEDEAGTWTRRLQNMQRWGPGVSDAIGSDTDAFTVDLTRIGRRIMCTVHPDNGGSLERSQQLNSYLVDAPMFMTKRKWCTDGTLGLLYQAFTRPIDLFEIYNERSEQLQTYVVANRRLEDQNRDLCDRTEKQQETIEGLKAGREQIKERIKAMCESYLPPEEFEELQRGAKRMREEQP